jgi:hypothetical protein
MASNYTDTTDTNFKEEPYNIDTGKPLSAAGVRNALHTKETVLPVGTILAMSVSSWGNAGAAFQSKWRVCDGTGGTPDLRGRFLRGGTSSDAVTGGANSQSFRISGNNLPNHTHTVNDPGHHHDLLYDWGHGGTIGIDIDGNSSNIGKKGLIDEAYTGITVTGGGKDTPDQITIDTVPNYYTVIYIMKIA